MNKHKLTPISTAVHNFSLIFQNKTRNSQIVVLKNLIEYFVLKLIHLGVFLTRYKLTQYAISGFKFKFFDFFHFVSSFEHRFIHHDYFFVTKNKTPFIIDCGANIGDSVLYFKLLYPNSKILAFEADPTTFNIFQENITINSLEEVTPVNKAVFDKVSEIDFYFNPEDPGVGSMSVYEQRMSKAHVKIPAVLLSDYITKKVDFLKIDIEGAEINVLEDLDKSQKIKLVDQIIIEYHHNIPNKKSELLRILEIFENNGYKYQLSTGVQPPFIADIFQDILIYAYRK